MLRGRRQSLLTAHGAELVPLTGLLSELVLGCPKRTRLAVAGPAHGGRVLERSNQREHLSKASHRWLVVRRVCIKVRTWGGDLLSAIDCVACGCNGVVE